MARKTKLGKNDDGCCVLEPYPQGGTHVSTNIARPVTASIVEEMKWVQQVRKQADVDKMQKGQEVAANRGLQSKDD